VNVAFLLVTCCLEQSRTDVLTEVLKNLNEQAPWLREKLTVFDNASTAPGTIDALCSSYVNVYQADKNVGYWSAIDWWLQHITPAAPSYTYIIESDMIHYNFAKLSECVSYLDTNADVGSVRVHEYSVAERHLYNKDVPHRDSRKALWQSHTNKVTGQQVSFEHSRGDIWTTTFLTQLPALNRYQAMKDVFDELRTMPRFTEPDFQALYWRRYQKTGLLDGGLFHCNLNPYGAKVVTGSWTSEADLQRLGYKTTRRASIVPSDQYIVRRLGLESK